MGAIKHLPRMVKVGKRWLMEDFQPPKPVLLEWHRVAQRTATLYVVESSGFCKIGYTANFVTRFSALDCANPLPVRKVAVRTVPEISVPYVEAWLHHQLADRREKGEWFAVAPHEVVRLLPEAVQRGAAYFKRCRQWYDENQQINSQPEIQAQIRESYIESLECQKRVIAQKLQQLEGEIA